MQNNKINNHNYEEFIVNYLDQVLSPVEAAELFLFLEMHPELNEDLDELRNMVLFPDTNNNYDFKEALKLNHDTDAHEISAENYLYYFTAYAEGDLSSKGNKAVTDFISLHPEFKNELICIEQCKIAVPIDLVYPDKAGLKRKSGLITPIWLRWIAVAASALILFSVYLRLEPLTTRSLNERLTKIESPVSDNPPLVKETPNQPPENNRRKEKIIDKTRTKKAVSIEKKKQEPTDLHKENEAEHAKPLQTMPMLKNTMNYLPPIAGTTRQAYSSLYDDIRLSQELMLSYAENHSENQPLSDEVPVMNVGRRFNQYLQSGAQMASQVTESFNGWMLADVGVMGFNLLTDNEVELSREVKSDGNTGNVILRNGDATYLLRRSRL